MNVRLILILFLAICFVPVAWAETTIHPRVAQLEKTLAREGLELLKGRFPDKPFLIKVKVDPLFRENTRRGNTGEQLPYLDLSEEEIVDEWDDPNQSLTALMNRVRSIHVTVSIPSNLNDDEVSELKDTLMSNLGMIDGRDSLAVNKRNWGTPEKDDASLNHQIIVWSAVGWMLFVTALFAAAWFATSRIRKALLDSNKNKETTPNPAVPIVAPLPAPATETARREKPTTPGNADIRFTDPIKNRESINLSVKILCAHPSFPNLDDMLIFEKFGQEKPKELGALLSEFSSEIRAKIFSFSFSEPWKNALADPGEITSACVEVVTKCLRVQRDDSQLELQKLMLLVWRLDKKVTNFFLGVPQNDAFAILAGLPKSMSLAVAREAFPGSWGILLDSSFNPAPLEKAKVDKFTTLALGLTPLREMAAIRDYKRQLDLFDFLRHADPGTEREVYKAAGNSGSLTAIRPPFYKVLEIPADWLVELAPRLRVEEWAMALFNTNRNDRKKIERMFSDKQRFRYFELLRNFDLQPPAKEQIADVRERAAQIADQIEKKYIGSHPSPTGTATTATTTDKTKAA